MRQRALAKKLAKLLFVSAEFRIQVVVLHHCIVRLTLDKLLARLPQLCFFSLVLQAKPAKPASLVRSREFVHLFGGALEAQCGSFPIDVTVETRQFAVKDILTELVEKEQGIVTEMTKESMAGKPDNVIEKAVTGRMEKWFGEHTLMAKPYVPDDTKTVEQMRTDLVAKIGENIQVRRFFRMELGG